MLNGALPAFLAIVLLMRSPAGRGLGIGLRRLRWSDAGWGGAFALGIGAPGLLLVYVARRLGLNAQIVVTAFPDVWYRIPTLLVDAFQQGLAEEVVVCAFVLTRLRQLGWSNPRALAAESVLRGSYHLYQGYGGFIGNAVMGVIFGVVPADAPGVAVGDRARGDRRRELHRLHLPARQGQLALTSARRRLDAGTAQPDR